MIGFAYLAALLVSLGGLAVLDRRFRLAFWADPARTTITLVVGVLFFLAWDVAGLALGIFARGDSPHMTGLQLAPELPVEEAVFLTLLCYNTLLVWRFLDLRARRRAARRTHDGATRADEDPARAAHGPTTGAGA
ncbi:lycopene cyclase domain-containing protein [Oerskovia jenensis]|uniref:lycopene cyclase domain-containing protein n=1 Tax=Oerskovia jenensis TaxID=162169 RepID=UPI0036DF8CF3